LSLVALLAGAVTAVVSVVTVAAAFGVPLVAIFAGSQPSLTGPVGRGPMTILGAEGAAPSVEAVREAVDGLLR